MTSTQTPDESSSGSSAVGGGGGGGWAGEVGWLGWGVGWFAVGGVSSGAVGAVLGDCGCGSAVGRASSVVVCGAVPRFAGASTGVVAVALPGELADPEGRVPLSEFRGASVRGRSVSGAGSALSADGNVGVVVDASGEDAWAWLTEGRDDGMKARVRPPPTSATVEATTARRRCFFQSASRRRRAARPVAEGVAGPIGMSGSGSGNPGNASNSRVWDISAITAAVDGVWWTCEPAGAMSGA